MMNKSQNKNRKHPTCSRCRFHGKKDIRVLQHQCPFRNCTCSSCFLIKRRSIIYRAQKNLDKTDELSNDAYSPGGSSDAMLSNNYPEINGKNGSNYSISRSSDSSSDMSGHTCFSSESSVTCAQPWKESEASHASQESAICSGISASSARPQIKGSDHYKISDFQSLCLTFPELTASQLQSIFEQCGNDFQKTIDRVLMTKWCNDTECRNNGQTNGQSFCQTNGQSHNNNDWSSVDYASNAISLSRWANPSVNPTATTSTNASSPVGDPSTTPITSNVYNANSGHSYGNPYEWRSNASTGQTEDLCASDYGNDFYYDQGNQTVGHNWSYDYSGYWYSNGETSSSTNSAISVNATANCNSNGYDVNGSLDTDAGTGTGWTNGHNRSLGSLALGATPEHNV